MSKYKLAAYLNTFLMNEIQFSPVNLWFIKKHIKSQINIDDVYKSYKQT